MDEPLKAYRNFVARIKAEMNAAIDAIDEFVKEGEAREKEAKREAIRAYFDGRDFDLVPLEKIFDSKWLNKTADMRDVKNAILVKIEEIHSNLKVLDAIAEHGQLAKAVYLDRLDMGAALREVETLKANAERAAREKQARADREAREAAARNAEAERAESRELEREARLESMVADALGEEPAEAKPEVYWFEFRFQGTAELALKMKAFMTENAIAYEKLGQGVIG